MQQGRRRKIISLLRSTDAPMKLRSRNSHFKSKSSPLRLAASVKSSNRKLRRPKPPKLSWTRLPRNSNAYIKSATSWTSNGKRQLRTHADVTPLSTRRRLDLEFKRITSIIERGNLKVTRAASKEKKKTTGKLRPKSSCRTALWAR